MSRLIKSPRFRRFAGTGGANVHFGSASPQWSRQKSDDDTIIEGEAEEKTEDPSSLLRAR